jgi:hypothetical protein
VYSGTALFGTLVDGRNCTWESIEFGPGQSDSPSATGIRAEGAPKGCQTRLPGRSRSSPGTFLCRTGTEGALSGVRHLLEDEMDVTWPGGRSGTSTRILTGRCLSLNEPGLHWRLVSLSPGPALN